MSEFLRIKQRNGEIPQKENRKNECNQRNQIHVLPQFLERLDVEKRYPKEERGEEQHRHILHGQNSQSERLDLWDQRLPGSPAQSSLAIFSLNEILAGKAFDCRKEFLNKP
ncbi:MAG TPA: hypothetical protein VFD98_00330 [Terracidiphilus sp.]|jgi:hypothetical protein|nr:hypothetical protein [Terracidiphilus sp.]